MKDAEVAAGHLVVAGGDRAEAFETVKEDLDQVAQAVPLPVALEQVPLAPWARMDDDSLHSPGADGLDEGVGVVARICDESLAMGRVEQLERDGALVLLAGGQRHLLGAPLGGYQRMDFCRKASPRASQSICLDPPFPLAASSVSTD